MGIDIKRGGGLGGLHPEREEKPFPQSGRSSKMLSCHLLACPGPHPLSSPPLLAAELQPRHQCRAGAGFPQWWGEALALPSHRSAEEPGWKSTGHHLSTMFLLNFY